MKKSLIITISILCLLLLGGGILLLTLPKKKQPYLNIDTPLGVWWWDDTLDLSYLDFAKNNGIDEIYYCNTEFSQKTAEFIQKANKKDMEVYLLIGEKEWIFDSQNLENILGNYITFNTNHVTSSFAGVHLDIEPHQYDNFNITKEDPDYTPPPAPYQSYSWREYYFYHYVSLAKNIISAFPELKFDFDLPFWAHDEIMLDGSKKPVYEHIIDLCDRVFIMSYRDSAEKMVSVSKEELAYAKSQDKTIFLGAETSSQNPETVSYYEEGKKYMYKELKKLNSLVAQKFGISIHHIKSWKKLKI